MAAFEFFSLAGVVDPFRGAGSFLLCLAKYRADCPMNEICCDSDIFTIYQNETGFVKRSKDVSLQLLSTIFFKKAVHYAHTGKS